MNYYSAWERRLWLAFCAFSIALAIVEPKTSILPIWPEALVREGDTVLCHFTDRLGRNLDNFGKLVLGLTGPRCGGAVVEEQLQFTGEDLPMA
jgi:hypothetical protein